MALTFQLISALDLRILKSRSHAFPPLQQSTECGGPCSLTSFLRSPSPGALASPGPHPLKCYSGLGGAGRSRGRAGTGGEGRRESVLDTRGGLGRRGGHTPPWEETGQVWLGAGCQLGGDSRPPTNTNTRPRPRSSVPSPASEPQLFLPLRLPARRRRPTSARRAAPAAAWTAPVESSAFATLRHPPPQFLGLGLRVEAPSLLGPRVPV